MQQLRLLAHAARMHKLRTFLAVIHITGVLAFILLAVGVASTAFASVPQPGIQVIYAAFSIIALVTAVHLIFAGVAMLYGSATDRQFAMLASVATALATSLLYLYYHAAITVWSALPDTYAVKTAALFLFGGILLGVINTGGD